MRRDPLAAFDRSVLGAVAERHEVTVESLSALVRRHQEGVRDLPGVENLVYEWRRTLPGSPLVERRPDAYFCAVEGSVWAEFADALDLDGDEFAALQATHEAQFTRAVDAPVPEGRRAMVLTRE